MPFNNPQLGKLSRQSQISNLGPLNQLENEVRTEPRVRILMNYKANKPEGII